MLAVAIACFVAGYVAGRERLREQIAAARARRGTVLQWPGGECVIENNIIERCDDPPARAPH